MRPSAPGMRHRKTRLQERLELLRLRAAGHRLELAIARADLQQKAQNLQRGVGLALAIARVFAPGGPAGAARMAGSAIPLLLRNARWMIPLAGALLFGSRARHTAHRLRAALAAGTLGIVLLRLARRAYRKR